MIKKLIVVALALIIVGVVGGIFTFKYASEVVQVNDKQLVDYEGVNSVVINTTMSNIEIIGTDEKMDNNIILVGKSTRNNQTALNITNDKQKERILIDDRKGNGENKWFDFNWSFFKSKTSLKVYVPKQLAGNLSVDTVSGKITMKNFQVNKLNIDTVSGDLNGENVQFKDSNIESVSGDLTFSEVTGKVNAESTSGNIILAMKALNNPIKLNTTSGDIRVKTKEKPQDTHFEIETVSGDINLYDKHGKQTSFGEKSTLVNIETVSGNIEFKQQ